MLTIAYHIDREALYGAHDQWQGNLLSRKALAEFTQPHHFDRASETVKPEDIIDKIPVSSDIQYHIDRIEEYVNPGFDRIILHNVNKQQERFIEDFGKKLLPIF